MTDRVLARFLQTQRAEAMALAEDSDLLEVQPVPGDPPQRFVVRILARGLVEVGDRSVKEALGCDVGIWLPDDYLRRADAREVLTYLGPHRRPWHPNLRPPWICVSVRPGTPLTDLIYACFEVWTWHLYAAGDPLNAAAAQWARNQPKDRFPVDRRPLRRRRLRAAIELEERGEVG